jgi:hypothetical protein
MAASSGAIRAGKAFVEFSLSDKKIAGQLRALQTKFAAMGSAMNRIGSIASAVGISIVGAFAGAAKVFADTGSTLADMAARTGMSVEALGEMGYAASQSGASLAAVEKGSQGLAKLLFAAGHGADAANETLAELGVTLADLQGKSPDEQFAIMAKAVGAVTDPTKRSALAMKAFGKARVELLPMLGTLDEMRKRARELGLVMSAEDAVAADRLGDAVDDLKGQFHRVFEVVGAAVAGPLAKFLETTVALRTAVLNWLNENRPLVQMVAAIGLVVAAAGAAFIGLGTTLALIGVAAGGFAAAISAVGAALGAVLSPMGLVVAAVVGGTGAFLQMHETGKALVANLSAWFGRLATIATESFGAIAAALGAGDIAAAGEVLWSSLNLLWLQGTAGLRDAWANVSGEVIKLWHSTWAGMIVFANDVWSMLERGWTTTTEVIANAWDSTVVAMQQGLNSLMGWFEKAWAYIRGASDAEFKRINDEVAASNALLGQDANNRMGQRSDAAEAERQRNRDLQAGVLDAIGADLAGKLAGADGETAKKIEAAQKAVDDARAAWQAQVEAANAAAEAARQQQAAAAATGEALNLAANDALAGTSTSRGTFNGLATLALEAQSGDAMQQTANNTGQIVRIMNRTGGVMLPTFELRAS